ncbi:MAG TPA: hypothetical protein VGE01_01075, partial [Fimbriimonas sp.]
SAIFGAVVAGAYENAEAAQEKMVGFKDVIFTPDPQAAATYARLFALYEQVHDAFGVPRTQTPLANVMKDLIALRDEVRE